MAMLMVIYMICATRTNAVYLVIFFSLVVFFALVAGAFWHLGVGNLNIGNRLVVVSPLAIQSWTMESPNSWTFNLGLGWHSLLY